MIHVLASDLPKYMKEVLGFSVDEIGLYSSLPYLLMFLMSLFFGFVSDHLISGHYVTITQARKFISSLGWFSMTNLQFTVEYFNSNYRFDFILFFNADSIFSSVCIIAAAYAGCNKLWVNIWFTLAFGFLGNYYPSLRVNILDLSPNYSGPIMAVINGIASLSGVAAPTIVGMMIPDVREKQMI